MLIPKSELIKSVVVVQVLHVVISGLLTMFTLHHRQNLIGLAQQLDGGKVQHNQCLVAHTHQFTWMR